VVKYQETELDRIFGALADPSRRKVVMTLRAGESTVEELGRPLGLSTPGMMKHLAVLERSGLVITEKRGRQRFCRLEAERLSAAEQWMAEAKQFWGGALSRLANHLKDEQ
jgi:DNA-binding transcriptional ArsR family regulator